MTTFPTRLPTLERVAPLGPGSFHVRASTAGQGSSALARTTALDLSRSLPTFLVADSDLTAQEHVEQLQRLAGPSAYPDLRVSVGAPDAFKEFDAFEAEQGVPCALVLESLSATGATGATLRPAHAARERCAQGSVVVGHVRIPPRTTASPAVALAWLPWDLVACADTITVLGRPYPGRLDVTVAKAKHVHVGSTAELGFEDGRVEELVVSAATQVRFLRTSRAGRDLLEEVLEAFDTDAVQALEHDWLGTLEELVGTLEEIGPESR